jgi:hypothetical protein
MIYEVVPETDAIRQGDIFRGIPRVDFSMSDIAVVDEDDTRRVSWQDLLAEQGDSATVAAVLPMKSVDAIVITQNCDAVRGQYLCLCEVEAFLEATGKSEPKNAKRWQSLITEHSRTNLRWFYLPEDSHFGFTERKAVDFRVILRVPRTDLEAIKSRRLGRLNPQATEHFRESLGQFFRRYPYDEWYPLTREELEAYAASKREAVPPFPWQE